MDFALLRKLITALLLLWPTAFCAALEAGDKLPPFSLPASGDKQTISPDQHRGKLLVIDVWASWCPSCARSLRWLASLQQRYSARGFQLIAVNVDEDRAAAERILRETGVSLPVGYDPEGRVAELLGVTALPTTLLVDQEGQVVIVHQGLSDQEKQLIEREIEARLAIARR